MFPTARLVARVLVEFPDGEQAAIPNRRFVEILGISDRSVRRALNFLEDKSAVLIVQAKRASADCGYRRIVPHHHVLWHLLSEDSPQE